MTNGEQGATSYLPSGLPEPRPSPDGLDRAYWEATSRHELTVQRCQTCGAYQWEPEWVCLKCGSDAMAWETVAARGRIYTWERVWTPVHPSLSKERMPYLVVVVELPDAGGVRMAGNLLGDPRQEVAIGADVEAYFEDHAVGYTLVQWRPTHGSTSSSG